MEKEGKKFLVLFLLGVLFLNIIGGVFVSADSHETPINQGTWYADFFNFLNLGENWQALILSIAILLIIYAGVYDILQLVSIFESKWVKVIISVALAFSVALTGGVLAIARFFVGLAATLGVIGIVIEVVIALAIFVGLSWGSGKVAIFAAKRRHGKSIAAGTEFAGNLRALKKVAKVAGTKKQSDYFEKVG